MVMNTFRHKLIPDHFSEEMYFAWLIRSDIRAKFVDDDLISQRYFMLWWLFDGCGEYPHLARDIANVSFEDAIIEKPEETSPLSYTLLMDFFWRIRQDVQAIIPYARENMRSFMRWFYVNGTPERNLFGYLNPAEIKTLLSPVADGLVEGGQSISYLMLFLWESDADLQRAYDLRCANARARFALWCETSGFQENGLTPYLTARNDIAPGNSASSGTPVRGYEFSVQSGRSSLSRPGKSAGTSFGVNIIGYARGELGTGEDVRMAADAFKALGVDFSIYNIPASESVHQKDNYLHDFMSDSLPYDVNIFCLTGFDTANVLLKYGRRIFQGKYNIGYWPWELPQFPQAWEPAYALVDEIWASTRFAEDSYAMTSPVPVLHMPMHVSISRFKKYDRADYGLPEGEFLFLFVFDFNSYIARKNPYACIKAFVKAFPKKSEKAGFVFKVMSADEGNPKWKRFVEACAVDERIHLLTGTYDRDKALGLFGVCDAYVSLHRSEGFGRTMAEAMLLGKPVVATAYSGNADFIREDTACPVRYGFSRIGEEDYPFSKGQYWAEPDPDHAAEHMLRLYEDEAYRRKIADAGRKFVSGYYGAEAVGRNYARRFEALLRSGVL